MQLILIGYALELVFDQDNPLFTTSILLIMVGVAGWTSGSRAQDLTRARLVGTLSIGTGTALTVSVLLALGVFAFAPRDIIPVGSVVVGNAMSAVTLVMTRLSDDILGQRLLIESKLALRATSRDASLLQFRRALRSAMLPIIDTTKTVGLIKLPGAMTGMILAGASPLEAVRLQIIVMYLLVGAVTFTALSATFLIYRTFLVLSTASSPFD